MHSMKIEDEDYEYVFFYNGDFSGEAELKVLCKKEKGHVVDSITFPANLLIMATEAHYISAIESFIDEYKQVRKE